jgi:hypothetical protein
MSRGDWRGRSLDADRRHGERDQSTQCNVTKSHVSSSESLALAL